MTKQKKYLTTLFSELSFQAGWDWEAEHDILLQFIIEKELSDEFMNYAEAQAAWELNQENS